MKTRFIILIFFLFSNNLAINAQIINNKPSLQQTVSKYLFCELWEQKRTSFIGSNTKIFLNFPSKSKYLKQMEDSKAIEELADIIDALEYMSENGWELQDKNARDFDGGFETCYLFRRKK
jgi:hypothetical protein